MTTRPQPQTSIGGDMFLPNHSGDHSAGKQVSTPVNDLDIANKKYVDDNAGAMASLPENQIFIGNASSVATAKAVTGDIGIVADGTASITADSIVNADVKTTAAIDFSKLAALTSTNILVGNGSNVAAAVAMSGDATMDNTGAVTIANDAITAAKLGILTTKGDIINYTTEPARLGIGADATVLTADSAEASGMKWAAAASGALSHLQTSSGSITANSSASVSFPTISGTAKLVIISMTVDYTGGASHSGIFIRFDSNSSTHYNWRGINSTSIINSTAQTSFYSTVQLGSGATDGKAHILWILPAATIGGELPFQGWLTGDDGGWGGIGTGFHLMYENGTYPTALDLHSQNSVPYDYTVNFWELTT